MSIRIGAASIAFVLAACGGASTGTPTVDPTPASPVTLGRSAFGETFRLLLASGLAPAPPVERTALDGSATRLAVGDARGNLRVADAATGAVTMSAAFPTPGARWVGTPHEGFANGNGPRVTGLCFLAGGTKLLAANGYGRVARYDVASGVVEATTELPVPIVAIDVDEANDRLAVGTDRSGVLEFVLSTFAPIRAFRPEDGHAEVRFVRYVAGGAGLLSALRDYDPAEDAAGLPPGALADAGLTRWSTSTGLRDVRFGGPMGTTTAIQDDGSGRVLAGTQSGVGAAFSLAGTALANDLHLHDGLVALGRVDGHAMVAAAGTHDLRVLRVDDLVQVWGGADAPPTVRAIPRSVSSAPLAHVFALGFENGGVGVYRFDPLLGTSTGPRLVDRDTAVGSALGLGVRLVRELEGHAARVIECSASPSGRYLATRDEVGVAFVWDLAPVAPLRAPGLGASAAPTAIILPPVVRPLVDGAPRCPTHSPIFSFAPGEQALWRVNVDGSLTHFDLPDASNPVLIHVMDGATPLAVVSALEAVPGQILVGGAEGSLRVCDAAGAVVSTLAAGTTTPMVAPITYRSLVRHVDGQRVIATPEAYVPALGANRPLSAVTIQGWNQAGASTQHYIGGRSAALPGGNLIVVAERYERRRLVFLDGSTLAPVAGSDDLAPRLGLGGARSDLVIGADARSLRFFSPAPGASVRSGRLPLPAGSAGSAFGCSTSTSRAYVGTKSGIIYEFEWK